MIWLTLAEAIIPNLLGRLTNGKGKVAEQIADLALNATGLSRQTPSEDVLKALQADPVVFAQVQEAAMSLAIAELDAETASAQIAATDRADARTHYQAGEGRASMVIAACVIVGLFGTVVAILVLPVPEGSKETVALVVGALLASLNQIVAFFFGSSKSSKDKTRALMWMR
jgi:VIT1/CCC1 family predicted Fe2+/Mn2+ transporter